MQKNLFIWQFAGITFTAVLGTILHFLYGWIENPVVAVFSAVNESTWEHMKLLFFPALLFACIQFPFLRREFPDFWQIKCVGILIGLLLIPTLFYTLNGVFGKTPDWLNILTFFIAVALAYFIEGKLFQNHNLSAFPAVWAIVILVLIALSFMIYTFTPPSIPLFQDPITGNYGIQKLKRR